MDPAGKGPRIWFQVVPEGKSVKNRLRVLEQEGLDHYAEVMADPEHNEFCIN